MKFFISAVTCLIGACYSCPTNKTDDAVDSLKYAVYQEAACQAVTACDLAFLKNIKVYEAPAADIPDLCNQNTNTRGCYCFNDNNSTIIVAYEFINSGTMLHEYLHAAFDSVGIETKNHGIDFWEAYQDAMIYITKSH